jgi:hypothetical protein
MTKIVTDNWYVEPPIQTLVQYIAILVFKALINLAPQYIKDLYKLRV